MSYYHQHNHTQNIRQQLHSGQSVQQFGSVVGTIEKNSEKPITGRNGDHLQFYVQIGNNLAYQVDVNTQSKDGSEIEIYIAEQPLNATGPNPMEPLGTPAYGAFPQAKLSYADLGLSDQDFDPLAYNRIDSQLSADLSASEFVAIYGSMFDDGGPNGKGIHETHYTGKPNCDGAIAIYSLDAASHQPKRSWYFFKFKEDTIKS